MKRIGNSFCTVLLIISGTLVACAQSDIKTTTAIPRLVKISGTLTDAGGEPLTGIVGVTFSVYEQPEGGAPLWMETGNVQVSGNGEYTFLLGSTRNEGLPAEVFAAGQRWLGVQAQGKAERPRVLMASVPYSLKAVDAETLGGLPASAFALAGTSNHGPVTESSAGPVKPVRAATPSQTGSGTTNYITIWTAATTLGDSKLYQTASGNVGLGTTTPTAKLEAINASATGTGVLGSASSTTGVNYGVTGKAVSTTGVGVLGQATAASGANFGVYGSTVSPAGIAVFGSATNGTGVAGSTTSSTAYGVYGANAATTGNAFGVYGSTASPAGYGVFGFNSATTGHAYGAYGTTASTAGVGILGTATATSGSTYGVYGSTVSPAGIAVEGIATGATAAAGAGAPTRD